MHTRTLRTHQRWLAGAVHDVSAMQLITSSLSAVRVQFTFDVISVEADGTSKGKDDGVIALLTASGFKYLGHVTANDWFIRDGFEPSSQAHPVL